MDTKHVPGETLDIKAMNIQNLKALFPEAFTEGKIDFDKLKQLLGEYVDDSTERYNFTWNGKGQSLRFSQSTSTGTLRPCPEESKDWDTTNNLYIEGDNLEVLKLLQKSYFGKVKMIYIDPPYNTGNDFVYPDDFKDSIENYKKITGQVNAEGNAISTNTESNGRYHTDWLNMMYPRLRLARNLLRDDGVIFISIDDNEINNLRKLCDEVFGEDNFIGIFVVNSTPNARDYGHIGKMHEYCIFYSKNYYETETYLIEDEEKSFKYQDNIGEFNIHPLYNSNEAFTNENRPNLFYPFYLYPEKPIKSLGDNFFEIGLEKSETSIEIYPPLSQKNRVQFVWRWGKEKAGNDLNKEIIGYLNEDDEYRIVQKMRTSEKRIRSLIDGKEYTSRRGTKECEDIFGDKIASFPKPVEFMKLLVSAGVSKNDIVLDFFSGSGTIAQAITDLNKVDCGKRKYICVQLPEKTYEEKEGKKVARKEAIKAFKAGYMNICEIGKERIRRAGDKIKQENPDAKDLDIGFKVLKLDTSNIKRWNPDAADLEATLEGNVSNWIPGRTDLDVVYEILIKLGLPLDIKIEQTTINGKTIYTTGSGALIVCLADGIDLAIAKKIIEIKETEKPEACKIVFRDNGFKTDSDKTNVLETLRAAGIEEILSI